MSAPEPPRGALLNFQKACVLTIDASPLSTEVLTIMLNGFGFRRLFRCSNIEGGVTNSQQRSFDIIFVDPHPFGDAAYNFVEWLRSEQGNLNKDALVILTTAYTDIQLISASRRCGADYVLNKPFSSQVLIERIIWLAQHDAQRSELGGPSQFVSQTGSGVEVW